MNIEKAKELMIKHGLELAHTIATTETKYNSEELWYDTEEQQKNYVESRKRILDKFEDAEDLENIFYKSEYVENVDEKGGEDQGSYFHIVFKLSFPNEEVSYIKFIGQYDSWNGVDWEFNKPSMVKQIERTVVVTEWVNV